MLPKVELQISITMLFTTLSTDVILRCFICTFVFRIPNNFFQCFQLMYFVPAISN